MDGILYVVATPIGNLSDITLRALETLKKVDIIACEDTRVTAKLLAHYNIKKSLLSYHQHSQSAKINGIINKLKEGKNIALVTDAGTPGISDPGNKLVREAVCQQIGVFPIPGPSAVTALASIAGIDMSRFVFFGFAPHKKGRETFFKEIAELKYPAIYFDSPHRLVKNLKLIGQLAPEKQVITGRDITKMFEEVSRGKTEKILDYYARKISIKGEISVIIYKP